LTTTSAALESIALSVTLVAAVLLVLPERG
jgi:hypothetical protein